MRKCFLNVQSGNCVVEVQYVEFVLVRDKSSFPGKHTSFFRKQRVVLLNQETASDLTLLFSPVYLQSAQDENIFVAILWFCCIRSHFSFFKEYPGTAI